MSGVSTSLTRVVRRLSGPSHGWVLLEVMAALLIVGVIIGPLVGVALSTHAQAARARERAVHTTAMADDPFTGAAWSWGPSVIVAHWVPGPVLRVQARGEKEEAAPCVLGFWVDGWFWGEWPVDQAGWGAIEEWGLSRAEGREALVRVRHAAGAWGPPWRTLVPGADGLFPGHVDCTTGSGDGDIAVRFPNAATAAVQASWVEVGPDGRFPSFVLLPLPYGWSEVTVGGLKQSWVGERGRGLDVFY